MPPVPHPKASPSAQLDLCLRVARAHAAMIKRFDQRLGNHHGIGFTDFLVMSELGGAADGRMRRVDLAQALNLSQSGVTRLLLPLEKIGVVKREPDPRDARVAYAKLTTAGKRLLTEANATAEETAKLLIGEQLEGKRFGGVAAFIAAASFLDKVAGARPVSAS